MGRAASPANPNLVNLTTAAKILGVTLKSVQNWAKEPGFPIPDGDRRSGKSVTLDMHQVIPWYVEHEIKKRGLTPNTAESRKLDKTTEEIRRIKLSNDEREGILLPRDDVAQAFGGAMILLRQEMDGIAGRLAAGDAVLRERIQGETRGAVNRYCDRLESCLNNQATTEIGEDATEAERSPVGQSKKDSAEGGC